MVRYKNLKEWTESEGYAQEIFEETGMTKDGIIRKVIAQNSTFINTDRLDKEIDKRE